jgi:hypothetical protein
VKIVTVETDADGEFTYERRMAGQVLGIAIDLGDLDTPDIAISDGVWDTEILSVTGLAADGIYEPLVQAQDTDGADIIDVYTQPVIFGSLKIEVTGGGANKTGTIRLVFG